MRAAIDTSCDDAAEAIMSGMRALSPGALATIGNRNVLLIIHIQRGIWRCCGSSLFAGSLARLKRKQNSLSIPAFYLNHVGALSGNNGNAMSI